MSKAKLLQEPSERNKIFRSAGWQSQSFSCGNGGTTLAQQAAAYFAQGIALLRRKGTADALALASELKPFVAKAERVQ